MSTGAWLLREKEMLAKAASANALKGQCMFESSHRLGVRCAVCGA
jgi:hypothetical protein